MSFRQLAEKIPPPKATHLGGQAKIYQPPASQKALASVRTDSGRDSGKLPLRNYEKSNGPWMGR